MKLEQGSSAPDVAFGSSGGGEVSLSQLWAERPLVLAFLRHFG